jgi:hypothetical protein
MSKDGLSGVGHPVLEFYDNIGPEPSSSDSSNRLLSQDIQALRALASAESTMKDSITEPSSVKKMSAQVAISSSTTRSFSESGATNVSQPSVSDVCHPSKRLRLTSTSSEEAVSTLLDIQKMISNVLDKLNQDQPHSLMPDVSVNFMSDTIEVAVDRVGDDSSDDSSSTRSSFDDCEIETELTTSQPRGLQHRSTQRRRWTSAEEKLLRRLKSTQKRNGMPSDCEIASKLDRSENGVKQHWDIMLQKNRGKR